MSASAAARDVAASGPKVYAKEGSAIAASQARSGENSYYYSVGKTAPPAATEAEGEGVEVEAPRQPKAVSQKAVALAEVTISSYSMLDDDGVVKVHIPMAGAAALPEGSISCSFRER